jgi:hypothetical protein
LLRIIEVLAAENAALRTENQQFHDELVRLKAGSGKPTIKSSVTLPTADHSSEADRHTRTLSCSLKTTQRVLGLYRALLA